MYEVVSCLSDKALDLENIAHISTTKNESLRSTVCKGENVTKYETPNDLFIQR
ncbi:MAG TPA: hypothetical protein VIO64_22640 [Pseudobacteroides sp.]